MNTRSKSIDAERGRRAEPAPSASQEAAPTTAQLRATIPSGRTVTLDSAHEPSAASFDTDDEAAGRPAQAAAIRQAMAHEGQLPAQPPRSAASRGLPVGVWVVVAIVAAVVAWFLLR
jgi:hypothetical protein